MTTATYRIYRERHPGGTSNFVVLYNAKRIVPEVHTAKGLGRQLYEMVRNHKHPDHTYVHIFFTKEMEGRLHVGDLGSDHLVVPLSEDEAFEVINEYGFFKIEVRQKDRIDARKSRS